MFWYSDFVTKFEFWFCCLHITKHVEINSSFILLLFFLLLLVSFQFLNVFCCCILSILCSRISVYCVLSWSHELWAVTTFSVLKVKCDHRICTAVVDESEISLSSTTAVQMRWSHFTFKTENVVTAHSSWLHDSTQYTDILLHNIDKMQQQKTFKNWNDTNRSKKKRRRIKELFISTCLVIWRQQNQNSNLVTKSEYQNTRERHLH